MKAKLIGRWGEEQAAEYLKSKGYTISAMGYRTRFGEIDVIAESQYLVLFVEVKTRKDAEFAAAAEFVDAPKQARIVTSAGQWLVENDTEKQPRFDVIEIYAPYGVRTRHPRINHIENAFQAHGL